jgi:Mce-associated membrane protein
VATWLIAAALAMAVAVTGARIAVRGPSTARHRAQVVDLSRRFAVALGSYDYHHLPGDLAAVEALSTVSFQRQYDSVLGSPAFQRTVVTNQSVSTASVATGPFVAKLTGQQADTFTVLRQVLTGTDLAQPVGRTERVELELVHTAAGWRVDQVDIGGS